MIMNESKLSLTTKVARAAMVLVALVAALAALQALIAQPAQASSFGPRQIVYESWSTCCPSPPHSNIYTMNPDGSGQRPLTNSASDQDPSVSSDDSKIAFVSYRDNPSGEIYTMKSDGSEQRRRTFNSVADRNPSISGNGSKIAFQSFRNNNWDIYTMNSDGSGLKQLTTNIAIDRTPSLSPDGSKIAFVSTRNNPSGEIYSMLSDRAGLAQRRTFNSVADRDPSLSGNDRIAFSRQTPDGGSLPPGRTFYSIYTMNFDGTAQGRLVFDASLTCCQSWEPSLSPGGSTIHFEVFSSPSVSNLYRINFDGSGLKQLTRTSPTHWYKNPG